MQFINKHAFPLLLSIAFVVLTACGDRTAKNSEIPSQQPAADIKYETSIKLFMFPDPDKFYKIYCFLSDKNGKDIAFNGNAIVKIQHNGNNIWTKKVQITQDMFEQMKIGTWTVEIIGLGCLVAKVPSNEMKSQPFDETGTIFLDLFDTTGHLKGHASADIKFGQWPQSDP